MQPSLPVVPNTEHLELTVAKHHPEYLPLPCIHRAGVTTIRWRLTWRERLQVLLHGNLYHQIWRGSSPLQPVKMSTTQPLIYAVPDAPEQMREDYKNGHFRS